MVRIHLPPAASQERTSPTTKNYSSQRCNFESNFPVDKMGTGYATLWNAFKRITAGCSQTEKLVLYSCHSRPSCLPVSLVSLWVPGARLSSDLLSALDRYDLHV